MPTPPPTPHRDASDQARLRHARDRELGFRVGRYLQPPPMLFSRDGHNLFLGDLYRGQAAFLLCGGPSLITHDLSRLNARGILTMAVNNAAVVHRPHLWCSVDDPSHFADAIWHDPGIFKFVPLCHMEKPIFVRDEQDQLVASPEVVGDMPAVCGFRRNEAFVADQWLFEDTFNWGNHSSRTDAAGNKGSRSVFYIALRLLFYLGVRRVYLLGCDFKMQNGKPNYAFEQDRSTASVRSNNQTYRILNERLAQLKPHFEAEDFQIQNCTPQSGLTVFPFLPYEQALTEATAKIPSKIITTGMYDRTAKTPTPAPTEKVIVREASPQAPSPPEPPRVPAMTLIIPAAAHDLPGFPKRWRDWQRFHSGLGTLPTILVSDDRSILDLPLDAPPQNLRRIVLKGSPSSPDLRLGEQTGSLLSLLGEVETNWWLKLDADALAVEHHRTWPDPDWFAASPEPPALIGHPWQSIRTGRYFTELDHWANSLNEVNHPAFHATLPRRNERLELATVASWCLFGQSQLIRDLLRHSLTALADLPLSLVLHDWASRRGRQTLITDLKTCGWSHTYVQRGRQLAQLRRAKTPTLSPPAAQSATPFIRVREAASCPK